MATIKEQIEMIRAEIDKTQKNKATNAHIGKLKAKIAQLKLKDCLLYTSDAADD